MLLGLYTSSVSSRKYVQTNFPRAGFKLGSLGPEAIAIPIEPTLLVPFFNYFQQSEIHFPKRQTTIIQSQSLTKQLKSK